MKGPEKKSSLHLAKDNISLEKDKNAKRINQTKLINHLNRINFRDGNITLHFKHKKYGHILNIQAKPQICNNCYLRCLWSEYADAEKNIKHFIFIHFSFADGLKHFHVTAKLLELNDNGVYLELPESAFERKTREIKRHTCKGVTAQISQNSKIAHGFLESFSAQSLGINLAPNSEHPRHELDETLPVSVVLCRGSQYIYSGNCDIIRHNKTDEDNYLIVKPVHENIQIFKPKEIRSERLQLSPNPTIIFNHPITEKKISLGLIDISGTGFAVAEDIDSALLMPGMIYPELEIEFIHGFRIKCKAQVVYRKPEDDHIKCGVAILDMPSHDHLKLSSLLHQAKNQHSFINTTNIDLDALWDFFFESGFVYPEKYAHIIDQKKKFNDLYKTLYSNSTDIFRHVTYQDKGKIYGHVSMFRYYKNTWLMHHHAAVKSSKHKAGLVVMEHILQYINESHPLTSSKMQYIACYFRPNNRFANRVFGGAARALDNSKKCSLDDFAYFHVEPTGKNKKLNPEWSLEPVSIDDLVILKHWYKIQSDGLMLKGLDLTTDAINRDTLTNEEYKKADLQRKRIIYSLKKDDELMAIFVINLSDLGLNMSDLTNCIQAFVLEEKEVSKTILYSAINTFTEYFPQEEVPVLLHPTSYTETHSLEFEKIYELTVLNLDFISPYIQYMKSLTTLNKRKIKDQA